MKDCVITTVKLDPFLQQFLRGHFKCQEPIFIFPKGEDLLLRLEYFLSIPPRDFRPSNFGEWTFRIQVPAMEHKNPLSYFYLSEKKMILFSTRIRNFQRDVFHELIGVGIRRGMYKSEIIQSLMEDYNIDPKFEDRIQREWSRYKESIRLREFRERSKKSCQLVD